MKRFLSAILALAMVIGMIPAAFANEASGMTRTYEFSANATEITGTTTGASEIDSYDKNNKKNGWMYIDIDDVAAVKAAEGKYHVYQLYTTELRMHAYRPASELILEDGIRLALAIEKPSTVPGFYKVTLAGGEGYDSDAPVQLYMGKWDNAKNPVETYMTDAARFKSAVVPEKNKEYLLDGVIYNDGISDFAFVTDVPGLAKAYIKGLRLDELSSPEITLSADKTVFDIGETAAASVCAVWTENGQQVAKNVLNDYVTYESANNSVATVANGEISAVGAGKTKIRAKAGTSLLGEVEVTVMAPTMISAEEEITDTKVNFKASAYTGGSVSDAEVQEVEIGTDITVTAIADEGYTFAYWKNSADVVLSAKATETFKVSTNMGVIAVFDEIQTTDAFPVYFYNGNGILLKDTVVKRGETFAVAKNKAGVEAPTLTGFVFSHWSDKDAGAAIKDGDLITALTRAVAIYKDDKSKTYTVKNGEKTLASGVKYGESVTVYGSDDFSCWKLGDKVVSYEKDYTFNVYGDITLTEGKGEIMTKSPVLVLDKVDGNYFLTYDSGDYELIEAGILFGSKGVSIESLDGYKAAAKKNTGQFTALPHEGADENTVARGYMICRHNGEFNVIYAD